jgi:hypothetical protein
MNTITETILQKLTSEYLRETYGIKVVCKKSCAITCKEWVLFFHQLTN